MMKDLYSKINTFDSSVGKNHKTKKFKLPEILSCPFLSPYTSLTNPLL